MLGVDLYGQVPLRSLDETLDGLPRSARRYSLSRTVGLEPQKTAPSMSSAINSPATRPANEACVIFSNARPSNTSASPTL
jgi:hypothetical protein